MNSFNHYAYGAVAAWMFASMAGIGLYDGVQGFKKLLIAPQPDTRLSFEASYESAYGEVKTASSYEGDTWTYRFAIPANTTAEVRLPVKPATVNGMELEARADENGMTIFSVAAGEYVVIAKLTD